MCLYYLGLHADQGSPTATQHVISVESSSLLLHSIKIRGKSCEPNNKLNMCTTSETEGEVIQYRPFQGGSSVVFSVACFLVS